MKKYKLIKEYPGSPELGTIVEKELRSSFSYFYRSGDKRICVHTTHVEDNSEYWEEVNDNIFWCVWEKDFIQYDVVLFKAWTPNEIECIKEGADSNRHYFKTKEKAEYFILYNKPCLSMHDILNRFGYSREFGKNSIVFTGSEETLKELIYNKL